MRYTWGAFRITVVGDGERGRCDTAGYIYNRARDSSSNVDVPEINLISRYRRNGECSLFNRRVVAH